MSQPLTAHQVLQRCDTDCWQPAPETPSQVSALERGKVLWLPRLAFALRPEELPLLDEAVVDPRRKNISFQPDSGRLKGVADAQHDAPIRALMQRHHVAAQQLLAGLLPEYLPWVHSPMNTLRLHPVSGWGKKSAWRKDDSLLHVDAFPSRPSQGERILRLFTNINPAGVTRDWRIGEPFAPLAQRFHGRIGSWSPVNSWLQHRLGLTRGRRTHYDAMMLQLHDAMKADDSYQKQGPQAAFAFPSGSSWICFPDQTPHAAMGGQFMLEHTWMLPLNALQHPERSPLRILEALTGQPLL
ncbi:Kdo hydroxylase family protein [Pantoea sp. 1.19]|uniref:Kdo hydroxylase family protein n=1 Tax=Pantoea sp. 1.19 TaxID=1925589 RepID=UPI0009F81A28|nr:Kdo hydroxylase family protein [Pantoea sp. 1.19]